MLTFLGWAIFLGAWVLVSVMYSGSKFKKIVMGLCAAVAAICVFIFVIGDKPKEQVAPTIVTTASLLSSEYADNEVAAERKFFGKPVKVGGIVKRVGKEDGGLAVVLEGGNARTVVIAYLDLRQDEKALAIRRGDAVVLVCGGGSMVSGSPALRGCQILD